MFSVLGLICAGMKARMKFGTLFVRAREQRQQASREEQGQGRGSAGNRESLERAKEWRYGRGDVERSEHCQMRNGSVIDDNYMRGLGEIVGGSAGACVRVSVHVRSVAKPDGVQTYRSSSQGRTGRARRRRCA